MNRIIYTQPLEGFAHSQVPEISWPTSFDPKGANINEILPSGQSFQSHGTPQKKLYLPIEFFRQEQILIGLMKNKPARRFTSSGTTSSEKSKSWFSIPGLEGYRDQSRRHFSEVMTLFYGSNIREIKGISLIPPTEIWPHSSLAQMIGWIGQDFPVTYAPQENVTNFLGHLDKREPCWVFGTAFHFVHLFDQNLRISLHPQSIIFETGGTKGQSRDVSRTELYQMIGETFGISSPRIVSEYGMSELACQAYDVQRPPSGTKPGACGSPEERWFRFQNHVEVAVMPEPGTFRSEGVGLLVISDPYRVDFPWPIRTEDRVELRPDGCFRLLGRAFRSPLKGCSTAVENSLIAAEHPSSTCSHQQYSKPQKPEIVISAASPDPILAHRRTKKSPKKMFHQERLEAFLNLRSRWNEDRFLKALTREFHHTEVALWALEDLFAGMPEKTVLENLVLSFHRNMKKNFDKASLMKRWLFILPENHSIVGYYPILLGYLYGLKMTIRIPQTFMAPDSPLMVFLEECRAHLPGLDLVAVSPAFRVLQQSTPFNDLFFPQGSTLLSYGSEETTNQIRSWYTHGVQSFGESWALSIISSNEVTNRSINWEQLVRDFFSLNQRGCKSSRLLLIVCDSPNIALPYESIIKELQSVISRRNLGSFLSQDLRYRESLEFESVRFLGEGFSVKHSPCLLSYGRDVLITNLNKPHTPLNCETFAARMPGVLPIVTIKPAQEIPCTELPSFYKGILESLSQERFLKQVNISPSFQKNLTLDDKNFLENLDLCSIGYGNQQHWNGKHQGKRLFLDLDGPKSIEL